MQTQVQTDQRPRGLRPNCVMLMPGDPKGTGQPQRKRGRGQQPDIKPSQAGPSKKKKKETKVG